MGDVIEVKWELDVGAINRKDNPVPVYSYQTKK